MQGNELKILIFNLETSQNFFNCYKISKTYGRDYEDSQTGNAPQIIGEIANFELSSGFRMRSKIPEDLFYDPDPGDALRYFLTTVQNTKLPEWIVFDKHNLHITFNPPRGTSGELKLKLRVTDADELGCEVEFDVRLHTADVVFDVSFKSSINT